MMRLTGITNRGLAVIAVLVAILWGCIVAERVIIRHAQQETLLFLRSHRNIVPVKQQKPRRPAPVPPMARGRYFLAT